MDVLGTVFLYEQEHHQFSKVMPFTFSITLMDGLLLAIYFTTNYTLLENKLVCKSFIFKRQIDYSKIKRIEQNRKFFAGLKLSLAYKGMVICYETGSELFITPENEEEFVSDLLFKNDQIKVIR